MANAGFATLSIIPSAKGFQSKLQGEINGPVGKVGDSASQTFGSRFKSGLGKVGKIGGTALTIGLAAGVAGGKKAVEQAINLEESVNAVKVSFGDAAGEILTLGENAAESVGLSNSEFNGLAVQFGNFATTVAGKGGDVGGTMEDLTGRAADFASVMNLEVSDAAELFQSGLAGETEPLRKYGIDLSAAAVENYAMAEGIAESGSEMTEAQKVQARYGLLMEQTNKTAGDFANTSDGLANQQRVMKARFKDVAAQVGQALIPILAKLAGWITSTLIPAVSSLAETWVPRIRTAFAAVSNWVQTNWPKVQAVIGAFVDWFKADAMPIVRQGAGILRRAFERVVGWVKDNWPEIRATVEEVIVAVREIIKRVTKVIQGIWDRWGKNIMKVVKNSFESAKETVGGLIKAIRGIIKTVTALVKGDWKGVWEGIKQRLRGIWDAMFGIVRGVLKNLKEYAKIALSALKELMGKLWDKIKEKAIDVFTSLKDRVIERVGNLRDKVVELVGKLRDKAVEFVGTMRDRFVDRVTNLKDRAIELAGTLRDKVVEKINDLKDRIRNKAGEMVSAVKSFIEDPINDAKNFFAEKVSEIVGFVSGLPGRIRGYIGQMASAGAAVGSAIIGGITDGISGAVSTVAGFAADIAGAVQSAAKEAANAVIRRVNSAMEFTIDAGFLGSFTINPPDIPEFHQGGVVPGSPGQEVPALLLAGERVLSPAETRAYDRGGRGGFDINIASMNVADPTGPERFAQHLVSRLKVAA